MNYPGDANYASAQTQTFITVINPDFSIGPNTASVNLSAGQQQTVNFTITPSGNITATVALQCDTNSFVGVSCAVSPTSQNISGTATVNGVLTITANSVDSAQRGVASRSRSWTVPAPLDGWTPRVANGCLTLVVLSIVVVAMRRRRWVGVAMTLAACAVILLAPGCGGGGTSSGGGGGGTEGPSSVSVTIAANKVAQGQPMNVSATVTGSKAPTGSVQFYETGNSRALTPGVVLIGGTAQSTVTLQAVGVHQIYATYSGDVSNISSKSANLER